MSAIFRSVALSLIPNALSGAILAYAMVQPGSTDENPVEYVGSYFVEAATLLICLLAPAWELRRGGNWARCLTAGAAAGSASVIVGAVVFVLLSVLIDGHWYLSPVRLADTLLGALAVGIIGLAGGTLVRATATIWRRRAAV